MVDTKELRAENLFSMKNHVCVITGGGTGIGLMYFLFSKFGCMYVCKYPWTDKFDRAAQTLAANGAKVYITGRRMEALENAAKQHSPTSGGLIIP